MKKGGFLRNVLDTIRSNQTANQPSGSGSGGRSPEFGGQLKPQHFSLGHVARHGFPEQPTALAFDPVQKIAAIGTKTGALRVFGRPGVDVWAQHKPEFAVTHIKFIVNQGAIITVTSDESIHLWSLRGPNLKLQLSANASSCSPAQAAASGSGNLSSVSPQSGASASAASAIGSSGSTSAATASLISHHHHHHQNPDSGAQPGDPDYLMTTDRLAGSPTGDQGKLAQFSRQPEILHTLKFQREHITYLHQTLMSKWLYIGTERGNVHVVNVETFELSGYSIAWNKAIELSRKTHPGSIIHISECPQDSNKLLIGYESGCIALWDLKNRNADGRYYHTENLLWLAWHYEGKQFVAAHGDGTLVTWQTRSNTRPAAILHPHAKTSTHSTTSSELHHQDSTTGGLQPTLASSFARALNNELYRPINKVDWKTSKNSEQFILFSGGLPYDGLVEQPSADTSPCQTGSRPSPGPQQQQQQQQQQYLKASSASPSSLASPSPISPSTSPSLSYDKGAATTTRQSLSQQQRKNLRSTSLTVMYGKSITVLEMDDTIVDFITICDNSPYENDTSDPLAVIVLLSNDLILIDLTSAGYPSFDSPYPANGLTESPVTCVQYLADCSSDLIPFLYSTSQNVVSRAPKKGFSDKEWPINGGEWGQSMQSYPELVLTGHADGTIKFWDMSGVNFDLISKIRTSKLFERPNKLSNSIIVYGGQQQQSSSSSSKRSSNLSKPTSPLPPGLTVQQQQQQSADYQSADFSSTPMSEFEQFADQPVEENFFAIDKIEYCPSTRHLLVAGALSQVIQFRLNKKETQSSNEVTTILVEPTAAANKSEPNQARQHLLLKARSSPAAAGSSSGGSSSSSGSQRGRASGFQPEVICLTPLLVSSVSHDDYGAASASSSGFASSSSGATTTIAHYCQAPPKVTALALQSTHSILAYAHENGIVLVDIIQKCVIMSATLADLYGGASIMTNNRDISSQPFAILQHHYQATGGGAGSPLSGSNNPSVSTGEFNRSNHNNNNGGATDNGGTGAGGSLAFHHHHQSKHLASQRGEGEAYDNGAGDNGALAASLHKSAAPVEPSAGAASSQFANLTSSLSGQPPKQQQPPPQQQSRFTANSMFQRQLSTTALNSASSQSASTTGGSGKQQHSSSSSSVAGGGPRLFQRQMTASQLFSSSSAAQESAASSCNKQRAAALLASARAGDLNAASSLASSASCLTGTGSPGAHNTPARSSSAVRGRQMPPLEGPSPQANEPMEQAKKPAKNKRIISRMLSISAIHTSVGGGGGSSGGGDSLGAGSSAGDMQSTETGSPVTTTTMTNVGDQVADKIDSSFTRSRSSSSSSTAAPADGGQQQQSAGESVQCLCFLDWTQATQSQQPPAATGAGSVGSAAAASQASPATAASAGPNNKSLGSIDNSTAGQLALWLGTSQGCVLLLSLAMPDSENDRVLQLQSVSAEPIPQAAIKLPGAILSLATFTSEASRPSAGQAGTTPSGGTASMGSQSSSLEGDSVGPQSAGSALSSGGGGTLRGQESPGHSSFDSRTFLAIVSEKQAKVYQIPPQSAGRGEHHSAAAAAAAASHHKLGSLSGVGGAEDSPMAKLLTSKTNCISKLDLSDSSFACRAGLVQMRQPDESCLVCYLATGSIVVYALPRLRPLLEADFVPYSSPRIGSSMCFSRNGHCLYRPSSGELCKFTISAQYRSLINEMTGCLFVSRDMPEMPRGNFFKSLFSVTSSVTSKQSDRDELFGEAGKGSRGVAKHISSGGAAGTLEKLKSAAVGTMGHDLRVAREGLDERGEKLGEIEDKTLAMMNQSESYASTAHQLAQKFKDKKWYQF